MEELGKLWSRYYVIRTSGIFAKNTRFLEIYEEGISCFNPNITKATKGKDKEVFLFKDQLEVTLSDRNEKDISVKAGKQNFTLTCNERSKLLSDIMYCQVIKRL